MRPIDADALNAAFLDYPKMMTFHGGLCAVNLDAVLLEIRRAPTIEAEPVRHGRWVNSPGKFGTTDHHHKECGHTYSSFDENGANYCPNCGAKMDGGGDE